MSAIRAIHPDFLALLKRKDDALVALFRELRSFVLGIQPGANELLYHTHALTAVFSLSDKLGDAFCMIPIYTSHLHLGFNKGTLLDDPNALLTGTGNLIRHIPVRASSDFRNPEVTALLRSAVAFAMDDMDKPSKLSGRTISKIKAR
jgi:Domain of unknown function (DU1801)